MVIIGSDLKRLLEEKFVSVPKAAEALGINMSNLYDHINGKKTAFVGRTAQVLCDALNLSPEQLEILGLAPEERKRTKEEVRTAIDLLKEGNGERIEADKILELIGNRSIRREHILPLIHEVQIEINKEENRRLYIAPPTRNLRIMSHDREQTGLDTRLRNLKSFYTPNRTKRRRKNRAIKRVQSENPYFLLGGVYQSFVESVLALAHLDDRTYTEVALTYEKEPETGRLTKTRNIADVLALEGFAINKNKRKAQTEKGKKRRIILYEVKLGRQRQNLGEQVKAQLQAARARWGNQADIEARIIAGNVDDFYTIFDFPEGTREIDENTLQRMSQNTREAQEEKQGLANLEQVVDYEDHISIMPLSVMMRQAVLVIGKRAESINWTEGPFKEAIGGLLRYGRENPEEFSQLGVDIEELEALKKVEEGLSDNLRQYSGIFGKTILATYIVKLNKAIQARDLSLAQIKRYDENMYLLSHYLRSSRFRKSMTHRKLNKRNRADAIERTSPLEELINLFKNIMIVSENNQADVSEYVGGWFRSIAPKSLGIRNWFRRLRGKEQLHIDEERLKKQALWMTQEQVWSGYLPNWRELLRKRKRTEIRYEHRGLDEDFAYGTRVFTKRKQDKNNWIRDSLEAISVDSSTYNLEDTEQLEEVLNILEEYQFESEKSKDDVIRAQELRLERLSRQISDLESVTDPAQYSKASGINLRKYHSVLSSFGLEDSLDSIPRLRSIRRRDRVKRAAVHAGNLLERVISKLPFIDIEGSGESAIGVEREYRKGQRETPITKKWEKRLFRSIKGKKQDQDAKNIWRVYREFTKAGNLDLVAIERNASQYLESKEDSVMIDRSRYRPREGSLANAVTRSYLFDETRILEHYVAARILQAIATSRVIGEVSETAGQNYLDLARQELRTGEDYRSRDLSQKLLNRLKEQYESEKEELKDAA